MSIRLAARGQADARAPGLSPKPVRKGAGRGLRWGACPDVVADSRLFLRDLGSFGILTSRARRASEPVQVGTDRGGKEALTISP